MSKEEVKTFDSKSHELLVKGGFIDQVASGIFTLLPLGLRTFLKIEQIIRKEMDAIGAQEVLMPSLQPKKNWEISGRWDTVDILYKINSRHGVEYALGPTHEEIVTPLAKKMIKSYRDLPLALYHFSTKFRDEPRPKSGILRGREFGMKDLYSFHSSKEDLLRYYKEVTEVYLRIFARCGLTQVKITEASGGSFTKKYSHEFNVLTSAGEVELLYCDTCNFAQNTEITTHKVGDTCPICGKGTLAQDKAIEVGNIFDLGSKFSDAFELFFLDAKGAKQPIVMGCYGIGTTRLLGAIAEIHRDKQGMIWPEEIAPYCVHLIGFHLDNEEVKKQAFEVYEALCKLHIKVIFDERENVSPGTKFADADYIGIPIRLVVSKRTEGKIEYKKRVESTSKLLTMDEIAKVLTKSCCNCTCER